MLQDVIVLLGFELLREHNGFAAYLWEKSFPTCDQREAPDLEALTNVLLSFSYTSIAILTHPCSNTHTHITLTHTVYPQHPYQPYD